MVDYSVDYICSLCEHRMCNKVKDEGVEKELATIDSSDKADCLTTEMKNIDSGSSEMRVNIEISEGAIQQIQYDNQCYLQ